MYKLLKIDRRGLERQLDLPVHDCKVSTPYPYQYSEILTR